MGNVNASQNRGVNGVEGSGVHATHKGQQKGEKVRPEQCGDAAVEGGREGEEKREEPLFVTVSGLSRSIISRKVLLTALIFRLFLPFPCCSSFPFVSVAAPFLFLIVNSARSFRRLSARRHA